MEAGEYGLPRGTCFVARRLEVVTVAGLLWISWCVLGAAGFRFFFPFFIFQRTRPAASMRPPCLIFHLSTSRHYVPAIQTNARGAMEPGSHQHTAARLYRVETLLLGLPPRFSPIYYVPMILFVL